MAGIAVRKRPWPNIFVGLVYLFLLAVCAPAYAQTTFTPYNCWGNLGFEGGAVNTSYWSSNGTAVGFTSGSAQAHTGSGALHIDGSAPVSIWGGCVAGSVVPATGDTVGGYFWICVLSAPTTSTVADVQMTGYDSGNNETIYCHSASVDVTTLPLNTWTKVSLTPTSATYSSSNTVNFNILSSGGLNCLIDDVTFGKVTSSGTGSSTSGTVSGVSAGVVPLFQQYVGSTFNGNFEVGNASVGNQYWGQYVPNQSAVTGSPDLMHLITSAVGTEPGVVENGNNMISITRGGVAWNMASWASGSTDKLPRAGDLVGGTYWLFVPANADLSQGFPTVSFTCQTASGQVTVADSIAFPSSSLVKGKWNQIPIYPVAPNNTVTAAVSGKYVGSIITAPQMDTTTNPLYAAPFYLDNIQVGNIPVGLCFSPSTGLTDSAGNFITALGQNDTTLYADVLIQNSLTSASTNAIAVLMLYQQGVLKSTVTKPVAVAGTGTTGVSITQVSLSAPLDGIDKTLLTAKVYLYDSKLQTLLATPYSLMQQLQKITPDNPNIKYIGRWTVGAAGCVSDYVRPYFKTTFFGTSVAIHLLKSVNLDVTIDGVETQYTGASGLFVLGSGLSPSGGHSLRVAGLTYQDLISFDALYLDDVGSLSAPVVVPNEIEFIGDSITAANGGYSWLVPEAMGVEGSRIAWPGIALVDGFGYYTTISPLVGMQDAYFDIGMPVFGSGASGLWDFSASPYTPNMVVINLGTNDGAAITGNATLVGNFQSAYTAFIQKVRSKFPSADIFVLRAFSIHYDDVNAAVTNAVQAAISAGDAKVHFIDTSSWNVEIGSDGIHPTPTGHATITSQLVPILKPYLHSVAPAIVSGSSASFALGAANAFNVLANGSPSPAFSSTSLPPGICLSATTGLLSGTPTQTGTYSFTITAANGVGANATQAFTLTFTEPLLSTFNNWMGRFPSLTGSNALATANPSRDGYPNLAKYAFNGDPTVPGSSANPTIGKETVSNTQYFTLSYDRDVSKLDLTYQPQVSTDLGVWENVTDDDVVYANAAIERHKARVPIQEMKAFLRVKVILAP